MDLFAPRDVSPKLHRPACLPKMPGFLQFVSAPLLLLASLPLAIFAIVTTTFAFWILLFRVAMVYMELFAALLRAYMGSTEGLEVELPPRSPTKDRHSMSHKKRTSSSASSLGSSETPRRPPTKSESFASLISTGPDRDFEGVGGWRPAANDEEEALWMGMNSRLELPAVPVTTRRHHTRSNTGGSQRFSTSSSPRVSLKTPTHRQSASGRESPEEHLSMPLLYGPGFGSMTMLSGTGGDRNSKVSFEFCRKSASSTSTASLGDVGKMSKRSG